MQRDESAAMSAQAMAQYGVPSADIAAFLGISKATLFKLYKGDMQKGRSVANAEIGKRLYQKAMDGDTTALIFWAKTRMRWRTEGPSEEEDEGATTPLAIKVAVVDGRRGNE